MRTYSGPRAESMEYGKLSRYLWREYRKSQRRRINKQAPPKTDYYRGNLTEQKKHWADKDIEWTTITVF